MTGPRFDLLSQTAILDAVADPIFIKDQAHRWVYVNEAFARMLGRPRAELIGLTDADLLPLEVYRGYWEEDDRVLSTGIESHKEEDIHEPGKQIRRILTKKTLIQSEGGPYVFGIIRDITDVYRQTRFAHLGEIAGNLCHELMTPLTVMDFHLKNYHEKLTQAPLSVEEAGLFLSNMEKAKDRLLSIIKSVRAFAIEKNDMPMVPTKLSTIVEEAIELATPRLQQRGVRMEVAPVPVVKIMCRGPQVGRILINLIHNSADAVSHLEAPWVKLSFSCTPTHLEIAVTDKGTGIAPEIAARLMTPFFTTKPARSGTGLGLSLASKLASEHGGSLWYDNNSAHTCFRLRLPLLLQD